ncbi:NADH-ubiquinone oxidoreductase 29.9 kDa subunit [Cordyceps fumosorosea ARSEF 2679]|uniref:NADH-ubiquinone oxidoreductase 29.9 kDa subunit n=1 Tax=Cordyceps fumosorosea (strain ARSEF 2679) TaxID=1081104 RepID=A0A168AQF1_CORFA|nr:NADH-ubiquinone oxidoreductase 29.9 kDa subunit [Cordyceps fumosorosea ARSEF 2679]OAA69051.1 NADH-ubiquinone oxidoreductase 29.9 kDa subunit [Cordyceps fumosorosea ARSEF 2679]
MRPTFRALARYLEPGTPTGLTGLWTHATPRSTLLFLYGSTLEKLQSLPATSLYRQSVEAVTKHRLALVEQFTPPGHEEWAAKARELHLPGDERVEEWDGEENEGGELEGIRTPAERADQAVWSERKALEDHDKIEWADEPQLTADQIHELEQKIGAGLIEEVIEVAEGELKIIEAMEKAKVWEDLEEKPVEGQWTYFDRT